MADHRGVPGRAGHQPAEGDGLSITVRRLEPADDGVAAGRLVLDAYRALPGYPPEPEYETELADVPGRAADVVVAVDGDGHIVGCVTYVPGRDHVHAEFTDPDAAGFRMLAVDPSGQGKGVGRALVQWCIDTARTEGRKRILIHSGIWMTRAHALYGAMGFERRPDMDWVPVPEVHLLGFALEL